MKKLWYALPFLPVLVAITIVGLVAGEAWWWGAALFLSILAGLSTIIGFMAAMIWLFDYAEKRVQR